MARRKIQHDADGVIADEEVERMSSSLPPKNPGAKVFADIAASTKSFRPARDVLTKVRAVPTVFTDVDRALKCGGWPLERVAVVHGPSSHGKTVFCHGLGLSFLRLGHMYAFVDAEFTTPITWLDSLMGEHASAAPFVAMRPKTYEEAVDGIRSTADGIAEARAKGRLPPDTTALFVVDSIRKLQPKDLIKRLEKMGAEGEKGSVDGYGGGAARMKANLNAAWLDELVPLMGSTGCTIILIGRESDDATADARDRQFGRDWKLTGGRALQFDSSMTVRISLAGKVTVGPEDAKEIVGERHLVEVRKTKVAAKVDYVEKAYFFTNEGGFDRARDLLRLGDDLGLVKKAGSWVSFDGQRFQGEAKFVEKASPEMLDALEAACRAKFGQEGS
jgi:recombination protein RecA